MLETWLNDVKSWATHPLKEDGNIIDWALFVGLIIVLTILWSGVIRRLLD